MIISHLFFAGVAGLGWGSFYMRYVSTIYIYRKIIFLQVYAISVKNRRYIHVQILFSECGVSILLIYVSISLIYCSNYDKNKSINCSIYVQLLVNAGLLPAGPSVLEFSGKNAGSRVAHSFFPGGSLTRD